MRMIYPIVFVLLCILMLLRLFSGNDGFDDLKAGNAALSQGNDNKAALLLTKSIDSGQLSQQNQVIAFYNRGLAWDHIGKYDKSIADYSKAIQLDPNMALVFNNRALVWIHKGEYGKAIADCNEAIRLDPNLALAFNNRGVAWIHEGEYGKAIADCNEAVRLDPNLALAFNNRGVAWIHKGEYGKAIADCNEAIRLDPNMARAFNNRAMAWIYKGEYDKVIADCNEAIRLDPNLALAFNNRAMAWIHKGEYGKAIADCNEAILLDPSMARAFFNRGEVHFVQASFREAFRDFMQAQKLDSGNVYFAIWSFLAHFRGEGLANYSSKQMPIEKQFDMNVWPAPVVSMFAGQVGPEVVLSRAADDDAVVQKNQVCEANFYVGELYLLQQKKNQARDYFQKAKRGCPREYIEFMGAIAELKRM